MGGPAFFFQCRFRPAAAGLGVQPRVDMKLTTRETAAAFVRYVHAGALALYAWNAQVSAALMAPLHLCEVVVRNAAADAIAAVYGVNWP